MTHVIAPQIPLCIADGLQFAAEPWRDNLRSITDRSGTYRQPLEVEDFASAYSVGELYNWPDYSINDGSFVNGPFTVPLAPHIHPDDSFTLYAEFERKENITPFSGLNRIGSNDYAYFRAATSGGGFITLVTRQQGEAITVIDMGGAPSVTGVPLRAIFRYDRSSGLFEARTPWDPWTTDTATGLYTSLNELTIAGWRTRCGGPCGAVYLWRRPLPDSDVEWMLHSKLYNQSITERTLRYFPIAGAPQPPVRDGDGALIQTAQEIAGAGTATPAPVRDGSGDLIQTTQEIVGAGTIEHPGDGALVQTTQEIAGAGTIVPPGVIAGDAALVQSAQQIAGAGSIISGPREGDGALVQTAQQISGRGSLEGLVIPISGDVYTLDAVHLYTLSDVPIYTL